MFRDAQFELPDELPEKVTLYRGTSYLPFSMAKRGYSWTTDKRIAAWFAMRFASKNGEPLVLRATVPKNSILLYHEDRGEKEAVCFHVRGAQIDGDPEEWEAMRAEWEQEKNYGQEERLQKAKIQFQQDMKLELSRAQELAIE